MGRTMLTFKRSKDRAASFCRLSLDANVTIARPPTCLMLVPVLFSVLVGCGTSGSGRVAVHGVVTMDDQRVDRGEIRFLPTDGTSGPAAATHVIDGDYQFTTANGPVVGKHRVRLILPPVPKKDGGETVATDENADVSTPIIQPTNKSEMRTSPRRDRTNALLRTERVIEIDDVEIHENQSNLTLPFR